MIKIYTKKGDQGETCLVSGEKILKSHVRLESYGTLDELNSTIGVALSHMRESPQKAELEKFLADISFQIQNDLFNIGSQLACANVEMQKKLPNISADDITKLEQKIDELTAELPPLRKFILPGGSISSSCFHVSRTVCRRAERLCIKLRDENAIMDPLIIPYINRLSDLLFVMARFCNKVESVPEVEWKSK
jgi:cob(I)alamin adenosyltransferase